MDLFLRSPGGRSRNVRGKGASHPGLGSAAPVAPSGWAAQTGGDLSSCHRCGSHQVWGTKCRSLPIAISYPLHTPRTHACPASPLQCQAGSDKDSVRPRQEEYALDGFLTVAIDLPYHGERAASAEGKTARQVYQEALVR